MRKLSRAQEPDRMVAKEWYVRVEMKGMIGGLVVVEEGQAGLVEEAVETLFWKRCLDVRGERCMVPACGER